MSETKRLDFARAKAQMVLAERAIETGLGVHGDAGQLYRRRAEMLAQVAEPVGAGDSEGILLFRLGEARYAIPVAAMSEVIPHPKIAPAPGSPAEVAGLLQVRGEIRVVWDLRRLLGVTAEGQEQHTVLLLRSGKGLLVQEVEDVRRVPAGARQEAPEDGLHRLWMTEDLVVVLDVERMIEREQQG